MARTTKKETDQRLLIDISWEALLKLVILAIIIWAVLALRNILFLIFVVFIFVAAVNPTIRAMQRYLSRPIAVTFFFTILFLVILGLSYLFLPKVIEQINQLVKNFPVFLETLRPFLDSLDPGRYTQLIDTTVQNLSSNAERVGSNVVQTMIGFFGGLTTIIVGFVLSFYLLLEERNAKEFFHQIMPTDRYHAVYSTLRKISIQLGNWIRGMLGVMLVVGVLNIIAFWALGLPSPLALGIWSGLAEAIPYIGPFIGVIPGLIVAIADGELWRVVLVIVINFFVIQQLQNFYITPKIMSKAIGLSPVLVILAIMVGIELFGIIGAIIALPMAAVISVVVSEWSNLRQLWQQSPSALAQAEEEE